MRGRCLVLERQPDIADAQPVVLCTPPKQRLVRPDRAVAERGSEREIIECCDHLCWERVDEVTHSNEANTDFTMILFVILSEAKDLIERSGTAR
jgi:hypothetical protein